MKKATFIARFWAFVIDHVLVVFGAYILLIIASGFAAIAGVADSYSLTFLNIIVVSASVFLFGVFMIFQFLYYGFMWSRGGQTFGMKFLKIKLVQQNSKKNVGFVRGALRGTVGYSISAMFLSLGFLWVFFDRQKETWHDKLFNTQVYESN